MVSKIFSAAVLFLILVNAAPRAFADDIIAKGIYPEWIDPSDINFPFRSWFVYRTGNVWYDQGFYGDVHSIPYTYYRDVKNGKPVRTKCLIGHPKQDDYDFNTVFHIGIPSNVEPGCGYNSTFQLNWITHIQCGFPTDKMNFTGDYGDTMTWTRPNSNGSPAVYTKEHWWMNPRVSCSTYYGFPFKVTEDLNNIVMTNNGGETQEYSMHSGNSKWILSRNDGSRYTYFVKVVFHKCHEPLIGHQAKTVELLYPDPKNGLCERGQPPNRGSKLSSFGWAKTADGKEFVAWPGTNNRYLNTNNPTVEKDTTEGVNLCGKLLVDAGTCILPAAETSVPTGLIAVGMLIGGHLLEEPTVIKKETVIVFSGPFGLDEYTWGCAIDDYNSWKKESRPNPGPVIPAKYAKWPFSDRPWQNCRVKIREAAFFNRVTTDVAVYDFNGYLKDDKVTEFRKERISLQPVFFDITKKTMGLN